MATLNQILAEQMKLIGEAKNTLETAQKKPPPTTTPIAVKEATVAEIKSRVANLSATKADVVRQIDQQIASYQAEISVLEKQIEADKKQLGDQPSSPRPRRRGRKK
jgi:phage I-like protein